MGLVAREVFADRKSRFRGTPLRKMVGFTVEMKAEAVRMFCSGPHPGDPKTGIPFLVEPWACFLFFCFFKDLTLFFFFNVILLGKGPSHQ